MFEPQYYIRMEHIIPQDSEFVKIMSEIATEFPTLGDVQARLKTVLSRFVTAKIDDSLTGEITQAVDSELGLMVSEGELQGYQPSALLFEENAVDVTVQVLLPNTDVYVSITFVVTAKTELSNS